MLAEIKQKDSDLVKATQLRYIIGKGIYGNYKIQVQIQVQILSIC